MVNSMMITTDANAHNSPSIVRDNVTKSIAPYKMNKRPTVLLYLITSFTLGGDFTFAQGCTALSFLVQ